MCVRFMRSTHIPFQLSSPSSASMQICPELSGVKEKQCVAQANNKVNKFPSLGT